MIRPTPRVLAALLLSSISIGVATAGCTARRVAEDAGAPIADASADDAGPIDIDPPPPTDPEEPTLEPVDAMFTWEAESDAIAEGSDAVTLLVIFDKSQSMSAGWVIDEESGATTTRWNAASGAVLDAIWPHRARVTVGAILFPQVQMCAAPAIDHESQISFMPGQDFVETWIARAADNGPSGSTPMEQAFVAADAALDVAEAQGLLDDRLEIILLTDGEPNCDTHESELSRLAAAWQERGIRTTVMGLPGSSAAAAILDDIAEAGGTGAHQPIGAPQELQDAVAALL